MMDIEMHVVHKLKSKGYFAPINYAQHPKYLFNFKMGQIVPYERLFWSILKFKKIFKTLGII